MSEHRGPLRGRFTLRSLFGAMFFVALVCGLPRGWLSPIFLQFAAGACVLGLSTQATHLLQARRSERERLTRSERVGWSGATAARVALSTLLVYWVAQAWLGLNWLAPLDEAIGVLALVLTLLGTPRRPVQDRMPKFVRKTVEFAAVGAAAVFACILWTSLYGAMIALVHIATTGIVISLPHTPDGHARNPLAAAGPLFWVGSAAPVLVPLSAAALWRLMQRWPALDRRRRAWGALLTGLAWATTIGAAVWVVTQGVKNAAPVLAEAGWGEEWRAEAFRGLPGAVLAVGTSAVYCSWRWVALPAAAVVPWRRWRVYPHESRWIAALIVVAMMSAFFDAATPSIARRADKLGPAAAPTLPNQPIAVLHAGEARPALREFSVQTLVEVVLYTPDGLLSLAVLIAALQRLLRRWPDDAELLRQCTPPAVSAVRFGVLLAMLLALALAAAVLFASFSATVLLSSHHLGGLPAQAEEQ